MGCFGSRFCVMAVLRIELIFQVRDTGDQCPVQIFGAPSCKPCPSGTECRMPSIIEARGGVTVSAAPMRRTTHLFVTLRGAARVCSRAETVKSALMMAAADLTARLHRTLAFLQARVLALRHMRSCMWHRECRMCIRRGRTRAISD